MAPAQEAVELYRALARQNPGVFQPDLARSLGVLGQALEGNERRAEALASFAEGVRTLTPQFQQLLAAHAPIMGLLVQEHQRLAQALNQPPDEALLAPVLEIFARVQQEPPLASYCNVYGILRVSARRGRLALPLSAFSSAR